MRRAVLGILGLLLAGGGVALLFSGPQTNAFSFTSAVMVKTGAVLLLFWLAYHQVVRLFEIVPPWMIAAALVGVGVLIAFPASRNAWVVVLCLLAILLVLHFAGFLFKPLAAKGQTRRKANKPESPARR